MQPRLVAITYPSVDEGRASRLSRKSKLFRRAKSHPTEDPVEQVPLYRKIRRLTWHDLKSQISITKRPSQTNDVKFEIFDTSFLDDAAFTSVSHFDRPVTSKWQTVPPQIQAKIISFLESAYSPTTDIRSHWLRRKDIMAVQSSCRAWSQMAQKRLYETIQLKPSYDFDWSTTPPKIRHTKLLQLRRSLRSNQEVADLVKHLVLIPNNSQQEKQDISDLVASVVMACRNLESLTSYHVPYLHDFTRIHHALSTRTELTKHTWLIGEDEFVRSRAGRIHSAGILSSQQTRLFLSHHALWKKLETLNIISHNGRGIIEHELFVKTLKMLPSLKRLHVSCFDANDFSDKTLLALPPLTSLRLDRCFGVTEAGLCQWAESEQAANIHRLVLESQNITSLLTVSELFSHLPALEIFRLVQLEYEPGLPLELDVTQPLLASATLRTLEWFVASGWDPDIHTIPSGSTEKISYEQLQTWPPSKNTQHILSSILEYGFPKLRKVLLSGQGDLSGLLRWVRHTKPAPEPERLPSQHLSLRDPPYSAPIVLLRRQSSQSGRPSSPSFIEYDHWRRPALLSQANNSTAAIGTKQPSPIEEAESRSPSVPSSPGLSDTSNDDSDNDDASPASSRTSSPSPPPKESDVSRSSSTTVYPTGRPEDLQNFAPELKVDELTAKPVESMNYFAGGVQGGLQKSADSTFDGTSTRHSSISILLDGYAYTA